MDYTLPLLAIGKLGLIFGVLILFLRLRFPLWITIFAGSLTAGLLGSAPSATLLVIPQNVLVQQDFLVLCVMVSFLLALAGIQQATGQSQRLVQGLEGHIKNPHLRLVLFPALVGLLPMPGGALFSCPMIRDTARNMNLDNSQKSLINYWFRHIWEVAWPLYPGYALACMLLDIPLTRLWLFTFPGVFISIFVGWFFFLRHLEVVAPVVAADHRAEHGPMAETPDRAQDGQLPLGSVLLEGLPIAVTLGGAVILGIIFDALWPQLPAQLAFCGSLVFALGTAIYQGRGHREKTLVQILCTKNAVNILLILLAIYVFKQVITDSGIVADLAGIGTNTILSCLAFVVIPFISGTLTGIFVGAVGLSFPLVLGILNHAPALQEYTVPLMVMAILACNGGQMVSPLHVCLVVTSNFFKSSMGSLLRKLAKPVVCFMLLALGVSLAMALFDLSFS